MPQNQAQYPFAASMEIGDLCVDFLTLSSEWAPQTITPGSVHLHTKHEFQFVSTGQLQVSMDEDYMVSVPAGSALIIPPNILHRILKADGTRLNATIALRPLNGKQTEEGFSEFWHYCALFGSIRQPLVLKSDAIFECVRQLAGMPDLPQNSHKRKILLEYLFIQLGLAIEDQCEETIGQQDLQLGNQYNRQYYMIEDYINKNYNKKTSVEEVAAALNMSRRQTDRIVERIWGKTYAELIVERRMLIAKKLLQKTDMPCAKIAEQVGYTSYPGFYLAFRKYYGLTPEALRQ